jgi:hypothetical protein
MFHVSFEDKPFEQIEARSIGPLEVVEKYRERVLGAREAGHEIF